MKGIKQEMNIENLPIPVTIERTSIILKQLKYSICKIVTKDGHGTGFFCKINSNILFNKNYNMFNYKTFLITNHHIINKDSIKNNNNKILFTLHDDQINRVIFLDENRKTYFNEEIDISIIEINNTDEIKYFLELDYGIFKEEAQEFYKNKSIYNISYPKNEQASVSYGLLKEVKTYQMLHMCSTDSGSSGSPILNLKNNRVIGLHIGNYDESSNIGIFLRKPIFDFIQSNINYFNNYTNIGSILSFRSIKSNEIPSIQSSNEFNYLDRSISHPNLFYNNYNFAGNNKANKTNSIEIKLLALKEDIKNKVYFLNQSKEINEKNIEVYINNIKTKKFKKYIRPEEERTYTIKLLFKQNITNCIEMFQDCKNITSIDLSNLKTENVKDMSYMFNNCTKLLTINLTSFNTQNVFKMKNMFCFCTKLSQITGLSYFNTSNVIDMHEMFFGCESLTNLNLSSFDFTNANDIKYMLFKCKNLKKLTIRKNFHDRIIKEINTNISEIKCI